VNDRVCGPTIRDVLAQGVTTGESEADDGVDGSRPTGLTTYGRIPCPLSPPGTGVLDRVSR
jgi:hypothetical protein